MLFKQNKNQLSSDLLLRCDNVSIIKNKKYILKNISFRIKKGELITVVGKNGMGKSTICKMITNNIRITSGSILKKSNLKISYVPQINNFNVLIPISTIDFVFLNSRKKTLTQNELDIIKQLEIEKLFNKSFHSLSGGEKQKVILLRAILQKPDLLVLDEPTSFIDFANKGGVYDIINNLRKKNDFSIIMVSHDMHLVLNDTTWVLCINNGEIQCQGRSIHINQEKEFTKIFGQNWGYYQHQD